MFYIVNNFKEWIVTFNIILIDTADTVPVVTDIVKNFRRAFTMLDNFAFVANNGLLANKNGF